jgi:CheY-like chemotaxis protein
MKHHGKFRILLVEDNPADVRLMKEALKSCSISRQFHLETAEDGESAVQQLLEWDRSGKCPDLIILDLNLPRRSGHEVLEVLKADERTRAVPIIVLSSSDAERDVKRAYESHANCYVRKPVDLESFFSVVEVIEKFWIDTAVLPKRPSKG